MHATFNDLVKLRDHEHGASAELAAHLRACTECREQLDRLRSRGEQLRRLPNRFAAPDRWDAIQNALHAPRGAPVARPARPSWWLPAASAAAVVIAVLYTLQPAPPPVSPDADASAAVTQQTALAPAATSTVAPNANGLIEESQRLEHVLAEFSDAPRVTRASTALTVADLEDRIQWVDYRLTLGAEQGLGAEQSRKLWRERVELLNSLVAVRYAESRTLAF